MAGRLQPSSRSKDASQSVRGINSIYVKEFEPKVDGEQITMHRINAKIAFEVEGT